MEKAHYYNEHDPFAAQWLRELMREGLIPQGVVDERSIEDVHPDEVAGFTQCHWFAGVGGWPLALREAGWPDDAPIWTGSPPCQPFSKAGLSEGYNDARHLAPKWLDLIEKCRPSAIAGEQVASAFTKKQCRWIDDLLESLEAQGFDTAICVLPACSVGAPHMRQRGWFVASLKSGSTNQLHPTGETVPTTPFSLDKTDWLHCTDGKWRPAPAGGFPLGPKETARVASLKGYGNAIVPQVGAQVLRSSLMKSVEGGQTGNVKHFPLALGNHSRLTLQHTMDTNLQRSLPYEGTIADMVYRMKWKRNATPGGRSFLQLSGSGRPIQSPVPIGQILDGQNLELVARPDALDECAITVCGWPTPRVTTNNGYGKPERAHRARIEDVVHLARWMSPALANRMEPMVALLRDSGVTQKWLDGVLGVVERARLASDGTLRTEQAAEMDVEGQLNPQHSRWLMGYPPQWGDCARSASASLNGERVDAEASVATFQSWKETA